jgi:hypothetical protein
MLSKGEVMEDEQKNEQLIRKVYKTIELCEKLVLEIRSHLFSTSLNTLSGALKDDTILDIYEYLNINANNTLQILISILNNIEINQPEINKMRESIASKGRKYFIEHPGKWCYGREFDHEEKVKDFFETEGKINESSYDKN